MCVGGGVGMLSSDDEKAPNLFKAEPVGSGVPPSPSSLSPRQQKGLIQGAEWGH